MCYPFFSLRDMQGIYRFGHESFSSLLFSYSAPVPGAPTDQTASQGTPDQKGCLGLGRSWKWNSSCPGLSKNPNWDSNCPSRDPNKPCLGTNLEYSGFHRDSIQVREAQTAKLRVKYRMRGRTQEKEIKKKKKTGSSNLSLGSFAQRSQRGQGTATQAVASSWSIHQEK